MDLLLVVAGQTTVARARLSISLTAGTMTLIVSYLVVEVCDGMVVGSGYEAFLLWCSWVGEDGIG
jgi:hypothetical protein